MYRGTAALLPKGFSNAVQAFQQANQGYTLKNGDVMVTPRDLPFYDIALQAAGLPPSGLTNLTSQESTQYTVTHYFSDKEKNIEDRFVRAERDKDGATMTDLRKKWLELQSEKSEHRDKFKQLPDELKVKSLGTLNAAPQFARLREQKERGTLQPT